jgi:hypothetical protein
MMILFTLMVGFTIDAILVLAFATNIYLTLIWLIRVNVEHNRLTSIFLAIDVFMSIEFDEVIEWDV